MPSAAVGVFFARVHGVLIETLSPTSTAIAVIIGTVVILVLFSFREGRRKRYIGSDPKKQSLWIFAERFEWVHVRDSDNIREDFTLSYREPSDGDDDEVASVDLSAEAEYMWKAWSLELVARAAVEHPKPGARCYCLLGLFRSEEGRLLLPDVVEKLRNDSALVARVGDDSRQLVKVSDFAKEVCAAHGRIESNRDSPSRGTSVRRKGPKSNVNPSPGSKCRSREELEQDVAALMSGLVQ